MKKHSGMRPHDVVVLLKIAAKGTQKWYMKDLAHELGISASEISESLNRSAIAGLLFGDKKRLMKTALLDFLKFGLPYIYPQKPGSLVRGIPTAHSAEPLSGLIQSEDPYVWPYSKGSVRGQAVEPLHVNVPEACLRDEVFYEFMALGDAIRIGRVREKNLAHEELEKRLF